MDNKSVTEPAGKLYFDTKRNIFVTDLKVSEEAAKDPENCLVKVHKWGNDYVLDQYLTQAVIIDDNGEPRLPYIISITYDVYDADFHKCKVIIQRELKNLIWN